MGRLLDLSKGSSSKSLHKMFSHPKVSVESSPSSAETESSSNLRSSIEREVSAFAEKHFGALLRSIILTGSLARGEGTFTPDGTNWKLWGDAEFLIVFKDGAVLPPKQQVQQSRRTIEASLRDQGLHCSISLSVAHAEYLARMKPHIFAFELRTKGRILAGDLDILSLIPEFSASAIPLEDAWRMLGNRIVEQLEILSRYDISHPQLSSELLYSTLKLYLDMATSFSVFMHAYKPTYRERAECLRLLASDPQCVGPFDLREFAHRIDICTRQKLSMMDGLNNPQALMLWTTAARYARKLWRWELSCMSKQGEIVDERALMLHWMSVQPFSARLRGWLYVLRASSWLKSYRQWPRWLHLASLGSPRYWVYTAAAELFFLLSENTPEKLQNTKQAKNWEDLLEKLPNSRLSERVAVLDWQHLATAIAWNYHEFLEMTRS